MSKAFILFHLNLAYSSLESEQHGEVIEKCYWPMLRLCETAGIKLGIEVTGWTLERINQLCPDWVARLRRYVEAGSVEVVGSGYSQMIGPLVPYQVNVWNQRLGLECYQRILGGRPRLVMFNEMAYASGMIDLYRAAGYEGVVMDRDNICLALGQSGHDDAMPTFAAGVGGASLPVLWTDSIFFQKMQRYAHGDIGLSDYLGYFSRRAAATSKPLALYCNDAEVFDYRPGRFREESPINGTGEWGRIASLCQVLAEEHGTRWSTPSQALAAWVADGGGEVAVLTSAVQPVPVKKQAKYNVSRWAVSGRDDLWLNTFCQRIYRQLVSSNQQNDPAYWQRLCALWASDFRTHLTAARWEEARNAVLAMAAELALPGGYEALESAEPPARCGESFPGFDVRVDQEGIFLTVETADMRLVLNQRRGLAIDSLAFKSHQFSPLIGTLHQGYFDSIELGADYYTGGVVVELIKEHHRVTDLERVVPVFFLRQGALVIRSVLETSHGRIVKEIVVPGDGEHLTIDTRLPQWSRPCGSVRLGTLTFLPDGFSDERLKIATKNGGERAEVFELREPVNHLQPASTLVSCTTGLGGESGRIQMGDSQRGIEVSWDPARCAAFPLLLFQPCAPAALVRLVFSLNELDETHRSGGGLPPFRQTIKPTQGVG